MSGLEKFQASEAWRRKLRNFLFMERRPEVVQNIPITEGERYSLDIAEDLKNIIEQKKNQKTVKIHSKEDTTTNSISEMLAGSTEHPEKEVAKKTIRFDECTYGISPLDPKTPNESFENMCEKTVADPNSTYLNGGTAQKSRNAAVWQKTSDESFEALERMCDKTASDPNSTLFKYLHTDRKEEILAEVKKRSTDGQNSNDRQDSEEDQLLNKINNCTLLDDIEAPSRMWETTICGDTVLQTSPVKMVGLLRPSTIIEETPDDSANSDVSSQLSFRTATKSVQSDISSSAYDTAHDATAASNKTNQSNKLQVEEPKRFEADQGLLVNLDRHEPENFLSFDILDRTMVEPPAPATFTSQSDAESNVSADLIDLEKTFRPTQVVSVNESSSVNEAEEDSENKQHSSYNLLDESVIELISDDEYDNVGAMSNIDASSIKSEITSNITGASNGSYSFNATSEDDDKENCKESHEQLQKSMQFNDTMEEVEYLLKRGMEYMAAGAAARDDNPQQIDLQPTPANNNVKEGKTQTNSSLNHMKLLKPTLYSSAPKAKHSQFTTPAKKTPLSKASNSASKRYDMDIKPFPKLDIFAKPRSKELASKQQKFSHIVSPIGTYMKKTAQTPLMSSINCKTKDYFNSSAIMELENESRLYKPKFETASHEDKAVGLAKLPGLVSDAKRQLPKKAYISSDLKHIVDERTPITIPASKKIQKYLENAMMPAVLRHDGKFKVPGGGGLSNKFNTSITSSAAPSKIPLKESDTNSRNSSKSTAAHKPRRNNASLADLSLMSGDVSMYTIMDAQKF